MKLIVCEKPNVAQRIAGALSEGRLEVRGGGGVRYFEVARGKERILVAPVVGHVYTLRQKKPGWGYPVFDIEWAPSYEVDKDAAYTKKYVDNLRALAKQCDEFVNACDYDIEGSMIGFNAIRFACGSEKGKRMKFSTLTRDELISAYESAGELDYNNIWAGEARHVLDWFYGINLSRALMHAIRSAGVSRVMSIGRVQGPALHILAKREREISLFKPQPYWQLLALCRGATFTHIADKFFKKEEAEIALARSSKEGVVERVARSEFKQPPYPPFDLTSLQLEAYKCFGFSPKYTLDLAQTLYENSMISYPRTSSQKLPTKLNLPRILNEIAKNKNYEEHARALISQNRFRPFEGKKEDPAHPAIHPTGILAKVGEKEMKLYDLIVKRFLACFGEWATRLSMRIEILFGSEKYAAEGARTVYEGWIHIYSPYAKFEESALPDFRQGEKVVADNIETKQKETQPPKRYTEASIIQTLESLSLGTKATRAVIIETLFKRGYVSERSMVVSAFGLAVVDALERHCPSILDEELTRQFEERMEQIQDGKTKKEEVIDEGKKTLTRILHDFKSKEREVGRDLGNALKLMESQNSLGKCLKCGGELRIIKPRTGVSWGQFVGCSNYPKCNNTYPLPREAYVKPTGKVCPQCKTPVIFVKPRGGRGYSMCIDPNCAKKIRRKEAVPAPAKKQAETPAAPSAKPPTTEKKPKKTKK
ncbi:MAG: DNA topoisomerase I [Candidatus Micrarchaeota archaeon]